MNNADFTVRECCWFSQIAATKRQCERRSSSDLMNLHDEWTRIMNQELLPLPEQQS